MQPSRFIRFKEPAGDHPLPERFTFPFYYEPHPLAALAARELQQLFPDRKALTKGRMFGVLVVRNAVNETGYLAAYAGDPAAAFTDLPFVPPVFDLQREGRFLQEGEA